MGLGDVYFMDLPVYRLPEEQYSGDRDAWVETMFQKYRYKPQSPPIPEMEQRLLEIETSARVQLAESYGGAWQYNEVVGYLQLHFVGTQVRAEEYRTKCKKLVRTRRKLFVWNTWNVAPETELPRNGSSTEIYQAILEHVANCRHELPGRFIDSKYLELLGPFVDWAGLLAASENPLWDSTR